MKVKAIAVLFSAALLLVAACGPRASSNSAVDVPASTHSESMAVWFHYETLERLVSHSDVIVAARVLERVAERPARSHPSQRAPVYFTESRVAVLRTLKGKVAPEILVVQVGREGDPANTYPELPVLKAGTEVLLFLRDVSNEAVHADGQTKYGIVAPEGLYDIVRGRLVTRQLNLPVAQLAAASTAESFEARIVALVKEQSR